MLEQQHGISEESSVLSFIVAISHQCLVGRYYLGRIRFLQPPWDGDPPLMQSVWLPKKDEGEATSLDSLLEKCINLPGDLMPWEISRLLNKLSEQFDVPPITYFDAPYQEFFAYGFQALNLWHPFTLLLLRTMASIHHAKISKRLGEVQIGILEDAVESLPFFLKYRKRSKSWDNFLTSWNDLFKVLRQANLLMIDRMEDLTPDHFVPGTLKGAVETEGVADALETMWMELNGLKATSPFGAALSRRKK